MKANTEIAIRRATLDDAALVGDILAEAFANDPVMGWMLGKPRAFPEAFYEEARGVYLKHGFGHIAGESAAALWLPSGVTAKLPLSAELRLFWLAMLSSGLGGVSRLKQVEDAMAREHPTAPHYYLALVGVRDDAKGKGLGGRIIREGLKLADESGAPAYLENSNPMNTPLYERLGFVAREPLSLPVGAPPLLAMWRDERKPAA